jgi:hypothetical protein
MRNLLLCSLVLALDIAFASASAGLFAVNAFQTTWAGVPISVWAGIAGIVFLVGLTFAISLFAFRTKEANQ